MAIEPAKMDPRDSVIVSEAVGMELEFDAGIFRNEVVRLLGKYREENEPSNLILIFVLLQVYIECFLHQNMRHVIRSEFEYTNSAVFIDWTSYGSEKRYIPDKLPAFAEAFSNPLPTDIDALILSILVNFKDISDIRNLFAHGHKIAEYQNLNGITGKTKAQSLLTAVQLRQTIREANDLGIAWNDLLDKILPYCKALQRVDSFRFVEII